MVKEDNLYLNVIKDDVVNTKPVMNGSTLLLVILEERMNQGNVFIFCTFYIQLDIVRITMHIDWRIGGKVEEN